jgi:hypothetical protein
MIKVSEIGGDVACMETKRNAHNILVEGLEGTRPLRRHRRRNEDNAQIHLKEMGGRVWN